MHLNKHFIRDLFFISTAFGIMFLLFISLYHTIFMSYQNTQFEKFKKQIEADIKIIQTENINSLNIDEIFDINQSIGYGQYYCQNLNTESIENEESVLQLKEEQIKQGQVEPKNNKKKQPLKPVKKSIMKFYSTSANAYFKDVIFPVDSVVNLLKTNVIKNEQGENTGVLTVSMPFVLQGVYEYYLNKMPNLGWQLTYYQATQNPQLTFIKDNKTVTFVFIDSGSLGTIMTANLK